MHISDYINLKLITFKSWDKEQNKKQHKSLQSYCDIKSVQLKVIELIDLHRTFLK